MEQTLRIVVITLAVALLFETVLVLSFMYSGAYNVAASAPHTAVGRWILQTTRVNSISARAREPAINVPAVRAEQLQQGVRDFARLCAPCHGAPGVERGEYGKGITPQPPDLTHAPEQWNARELHWIIKHGIKLGGMPAFGPTHSDEQLWGIVSFVQQLPNISPAEYQRVTARMRDSHSAHGADLPPSHQAASSSDERRQQ